MEGSRAQPPGLFGPVPPFCRCRAGSAWLDSVQQGQAGLWESYLLLTITTAPPSAGGEIS